MDELMEQALLYDFYGELLTAHQRQVYEDVKFNDLSLGEIAKEAGISRQGVHDLMKRCSRQLEEYENRLHLVSRFLSTREKVVQIHQLFTDYQELFRSQIDKYEMDSSIAIQAAKLEEQLHVRLQEIIESL